MGPFRLVSTEPMDGAMNMAVDEALLIASGRSGASPVIRFYRWAGPTLTLGAFQSADEIDWDACARDGVEVVRRITGGRAVLHGADFTYSVSANRSTLQFPDEIRGSFFAVSRALVAGLARLGVEAQASSTSRPGQRREPFCFAATSWFEIEERGRKLIGSAQRRFRNSFLQQGSMPMAFEAESFYRYIRFPDPSRRAEAVAAARLAVCDLAGTAERPVTFDDVVNAFAAGFEETLAVSLKPSGLTEDERRLAHELRRARYTNSEWTLARQPPSPLWIAALEKTLDTR